MRSRRDARHARRLSPWPSGSSLLAPVMHRRDAGLQARRRDEVEVPRTLQALEQVRPVTREDRMDDEMNLVDQPETLEGGGEHGAAHEHALRGPLLELDHGLPQVPLHVEAVLPRKVAA